ncbi:7498_t:CDS:2 [Funneliformis mosseae]|uniref:Dihydroorotate dehydrogenase (quinone), mitochondrial n=1 Tax=Funneliformis mosseae TaxID=27381 RepID=A0A9N8UY21_FUNMO|nr:7498_t:CDS:2 [Funneliformis mosseae]
MNSSRILSYTTRELLSSRVSYSIIYSSRNAYKIPPTFQRTLTTTSIKAPTPTYKLKNFLIGTTSVFASIFFIEYYFDSRAAIHRYLFTPLLRNVTTPESSHKFAIWISKWGLNAKDRLPDDERLSVEVWGKKISNPICLAAGFDKHGEAIDGLFDLGFGYVEIGSVTPEPQPGNPKPRIFRLPEDKAVINRYGFNSDGHNQVELRLRDRVRRYLYHSAKLHPRTTAALLASSPDGVSLSDALGTNRSLKEGKLLGINLGKNKWKDAEDIQDYVKGVKTLGSYADVLVINVTDARNSLHEPRPAILVKIAPDLSDEELEDIADAALNIGVDGVIVSNTTISRPDILQSDPSLISETGGLSGPPVKPLSLKALRKIYQHTNGKLLLIGCGGISNAQDAIEYARAGATLVQLYTSFVYDGVGKARELKDGILGELKDKRWSDIIGEQ